jgi:DNA-binding transcriptional LysR family regulator
MMHVTDHLEAMGVFARVVDAKSFTVAAARLGTSKSRVSRHVSALESALAVKLLNRSTRRLSVTPAGALFYEHCARILNEAGLAQERLAGAQSEPAGLVRVTAVTAFATRWVVPALTEFHQRHPKIRVHLACSNLRAADLGTEGFDLAIRISVRSLDPNLVARTIAPNRSVLCATREYLDRRGTPRRLGDLREHDCVVFPLTAPKGAWHFRRGGRKHSVKVAATLETDEPEAVHAAVLAGAGVGIVPLYMASAALREGRLVHLLGNYEVDTSSAIHLVYLPNRTQPSRVRALIDFLMGRFAPVPPWETSVAPVRKSVVRAHPSLRR